VILAHHGLGEELIVYAAAGGAGAGSALLLLWQARAAKIVRWLRRK
jgi:hypothetical protein